MGDSGRKRVRTKVRGLAERLAPPDRGIDLALFSVVWVFVGISLWVQGDLDPKHTVPIEYLGKPFRVAIWWATAAAAFVMAWWPPLKQPLGFGLLIIPPALRTFSYAVAVPLGWVGDWVGEPTLGDKGAWYAALVWGIITAIVYRLARQSSAVPLSPSSRSKVDG